MRRHQHDDFGGQPPRRPDAERWRRDFRLLLAARIVSSAGTGFGPIALGFGVLGLPGADAGTLSLVVACQTLPQLLLVLLGGVFADRLPRAVLLAASEVTAGLAWGAMAAMVGTGAAPLLLLSACAVVTGAAAAPVGPALTGMVVHVVPASERPRANSVLRSATYTARTAGLTLAGPAVAWAGAGWALAIDAATYLLAAVLLAALRPAAPAAAPAPRAGVGRELAAGWREFTGRQWLWVLVTGHSVGYAVAAAVTGVLGPSAAQSYLGGPRAWSAILAGQAVGALAGAVIARWIRPRRPALVAALLLPAGAVPIALLAAASPVPVAVAGAVVSGVGNGLLMVLADTVIQQHVPAHTVSRVSAYDWFGSLALAPMTAAAAGIGARELGLRPTLAGCAVLVCTAAAFTVCAPQVRALRAAPLRPEHPAKQPDGRWRPGGRSAQGSSP
ncbi:MFS transporter [Planomonospora sp. ID91781]|uniref:MFS transporter n=1 Tax=Planomonospora sp. ID91781 TaxID=2738135 RepID=UPI0018C40529|nr:MFS transporter [Planomonospora sp. ID91781]MBG0823827.1 MFS transporter [Planomonospora sp. ID91781]